jgi:hypothetical protein
MVKYVEIVYLRAGGGTESLVTPDFLFSLVDGAETEGLLTVKILSRLHIPTDVGIHLEWQGKKLPRGGSPLGLRLARILQDYGLINHTIWKEEKEK